MLRTFTDVAKVEEPRHPHTLASVGNLADVLRMRGKTDEARSVLGASCDVAHEVLGGGRIQFEPEKKTIHIYGHSMGFPWQGEYRHDLSAKVCQEAYPDFAVTTSNEGY